MEAALPDAATGAGCAACAEPATGSCVDVPSDVLHGEHALQKLRLDLAQLEHAGGTAFLGRLRQHGGNVVVAVDVDHVKLVVRRVNGQLVAELVDAFVVQNIAIAPQHEAGLIAGQGSGDGDEAALRLDVDVLYPQADQVIEGLTRSILRGSNAPAESTATLRV